MNGNQNFLNSAVGTALGCETDQFCQQRKTASVVGALVSEARDFRTVDASLPPFFNLSQSSPPSASRSLPSRTNVIVQAISPCRFAISTSVVSRRWNGVTLISY